MKKKLLLLLFVLLLTLLFSGCHAINNQTGAVTPGKSEGITYSYPVYNTAGDPASGIASWEKATVKNYTLIDKNAGASVWSSGWYVVIGNVSINQIKCTGEVHLILTDGCCLTVDGSTASDYRYAILTENISESDNVSLTIYDQGNGVNKSGELYTKGGTLTKYGRCPGIGGHSNNGNGITINGGHIVALGGDVSAGIGSNQASNIVINGGLINSTGINGGAGIGSSSGGSTESIIINGGDITASGFGGGSGIGSGKGLNSNALSKVESILINDGTVNAVSDTGSGIGAGSYGKVENVNIYGGTVTASGNYGIGASEGVNYIRVMGGTVTLQGTADAIQNSGSRLFLSEDLKIFFEDGTMFYNSSANESTDYLTFSVVKSSDYTIIKKTTASAFVSGGSAYCICFDSPDEAYDYANSKLINSAVTIFVNVDWAVKKAINPASGNLRFTLDMCGHTLSKGYEGSGCIISRTNNRLFTLKNAVIEGASNPGGKGGNIYIGGSKNFFLSNVTVKNGTALYGGGIYCDTTGRIEFTNCTITGNTATLGGGVYILGNYDTSISLVKNVVIKDNLTASGSDAKNLYIKPYSGKTSIFTLSDFSNTSEVYLSFEGNATGALTGTLNGRAASLYTCFKPDVNAMCIKAKGDAIIIEKR